MIKILFTKIIVLSVLISTSVFAQPDTAQKRVSGRENSTDKLTQPYLILISADGFRYDYADRFNAQNLKNIEADGVRAKWMVPSFPSLTFPNHYSIVTGMRPATHGLVANSFYDGKINEVYSLGRRSAVENPAWYGGIPIWTLAESQGLLSASYYWVGSEAAIQNTRPTYYFLYNEVTPIKERIQTVVNWLNLPEKQRPHLITFYMPEVDHAGHYYGPESKEVEQSVHFVDSVVNVLNQEVAKLNLPVNFIFVSDHGMSSVNQEEPIKFPMGLDTADFRVVSSGTMVNLYAKNRDAIESTYKALKDSDHRFDTYLKENLPRKMYYSSRDDDYDRVGDIVLIAKKPFVFQFSSMKPNPGTHGYYPKDNKEMMATFMAWGPSFKEGKELKPFDNVQLYPLMAEILGLEYHHTIDGNRKLIKKVLKKK